MKKMKRAALAMASVTAISLVGCGGSNTTTTADTKAAGESSAEGGNSGDISGNITFPGGAEIQDMKQLKKRSRLFRQNTKV